MKRDIKKLAKELRKELQEDILMRYDNSEYWDSDIRSSFYQNNNIKQSEMSKIMKILGI